MERIKISTRRRKELVDLNSFINKFLKEKGYKDGALIIYNPHTTAGLTINEGADPDVAEDIIGTLSQKIPHNLNYKHREGNADAHIQSVLVGQSLTVIVEEGNMKVGTWQHIFFCEFDGPREREVWIKFIPNP
ncbi:MAG: secondary thiamine-phosphate synthase enzyme YjbQ [Thermoanaerobaculia bacterium]